MKTNTNTSKKLKTPWPTKAVMQQVYEKKLWGTNQSDFYSGEGSHDPKIVKPYLEAVGKFLDSFDEPLTVCDLGCGDFNVGRQLVALSQKYIAVDIVPELVDYNIANFSNENIEFHCLDIATHNLPEADCALLRQVFQHLSNKEIKSTLSKLAQYKYVILTEHIPYGLFEPNKDIISGQGIRIKKRSGVDVLTAPFHLKIKTQKELASVFLENGKGVIKTVLYTLF